MTPLVKRQGPPVWEIGFRPFYLLAGVFACVSVALWAVQYCGIAKVRYLNGPIWHAHEMLFGYTLAVISGFLLTAVRNWTQQPTASGPSLAGLAALWLLARVLVVTDLAWTSALVNAAYPLALGACIGVPLVRSGNRRNLFFVGLLALVSAAILATHLVQLGVLRWPAWVGIRTGLDIVLFIIAVIGGRVIPMFTNNAIANAAARRYAWIERSCLASVLLLAVADLANLQGTALEILLAVGAGTHLIRLAGWRPFKTLRTPLVWVLHAAYAWIPAHLILRILAQDGVIAMPIATHALTIGVIGTMTLGMMCRTARGHSGRPLRADAFDAACFGLILGAAGIRVIAPMALGGVYLASVFASALFWSAGFAVFVVRYWPVLTGPRLESGPA